MREDAEAISLGVEGAVLCWRGRGGEGAEVGRAEVGVVDRSGVALESEGRCSCLDDGVAGCGVK